MYVVALDGSGLRRVTDVARRLRPARLHAGRPASSSPPSPTSARTGWTSSPGSRCRAAWTPDGALRPLLDPEQHHRGDETPATVVVDGAVLVGVQRRGAVELLRVPLDGGAPETLVDGPFTVRGVAAAGGVVVAVVAHDRSAGELVALTPGRRRLLT